MSVKIEVQNLRVHNAYSRNHGRSGAIPLSDINNNCFLISKINISINDKTIGTPDGEMSGEFYTGSFLWALIEAVKKMKDGNVEDMLLRYNYDQGESHILFTRTDNELKISIVEDEGNGERWDHFCNLKDFYSAQKECLIKIRKTLIQHAGIKGEQLYQAIIGQKDFLSDFQLNSYTSPPSVETHGKKPKEAQMVGAEDRIVTNTLEYAKKTSFFRTKYALNITWCPKTHLEADDEYQDIITRIRNWAEVRGKNAAFVLVTFWGYKNISNHVSDLLKKIRKSYPDISLPIQYQGLLDEENMEFGV